MKYLPYIIIVILMFFLLRPSESIQPTVKEIVIKGHTDTIFIDKPVPYKVIDTIRINNVITEYITDEGLLDSVKVLNALLDAQKPRFYKVEKKDSLINITLEAKVRGYLDNTSVFYTIKPRIAKVEIKPELSIYGGAGANTNGLMTASITIEKNGLYELGINSDRSFFVGYKWLLFNK